MSTDREHKHLRSDQRDPNRDLVVVCSAPVCWAIGAQLGNRTTDERAAARKAGR